MPEEKLPAEAAAKDLIQPFMLESSGIRGRILRLEQVTQSIVGARGYPAPVAQLLAEMLALTSGLSSLLKYEGVFSIQIKGDGPVRTMVADITAAGEMRGYAGYDAEQVASLPPEAGVKNFTNLVGHGYLAFTIDQGEYTNRYQGIVDLEGETLADCFKHYFLQSEQVNAGTVLAAGDADGIWRSAALILQHMPEEADGQVVERTADEEEDWRRAMILQASCTDVELLDPDLPLPRLLYRLFHEEGVRIYNPRPVQALCRCSRDRLETIIRAMSDEQIAEHVIDGALDFTCEFCGKNYRFEAGEAKRIASS